MQSCQSCSLAALGTVEGIAAGIGNHDVQATERGDGLIHQAGGHGGVHEIAG